MIETTNVDGSTPVDDVIVADCGVLELDQHFNIEKD